MPSCERHHTPALWVTAYYNIYVIRREDKKWKRWDYKIQGWTYDKTVRHEQNHLFDIEEALEKKLQSIEDKLTSTTVTDELCTKIIDAEEEVVRDLTSLLRGLFELLAAASWYCSSSYRI